MKTKRTVPDWLIGILLTVFFLFITRAQILDFTHPVEMKSFDIRAGMAASNERNSDIELVTIGEDDLAEFGRWPWPRNILARVIDNLSQAQAKVIALNILLTEPEEPAGLRKIRELRNEYSRLELGQKGEGISFYQALSQAEIDLDNDAILYNAMKNAGNVVLPFYFDQSGSGMDSEPPAFILRDSYKKTGKTDDELALINMQWERKVTPILPELAEVAASTGYNNIFADDGYVRWHIHVLGYMQNIFSPSYPVSIVRVFQGLSDDSVSVTPGEGVALSVTPSTVIHMPVIDYGMHTLISWNQANGTAFHQTPFSKVYNGEIQSGLFRDKIVIVGPTAPGLGSNFVTPVSSRLSGVEFIANSVENILNQRFISRPMWFEIMEFMILLLFGLYVSFILPRLKAGQGAIITLALFLAFGVTGFVLFFTHSLWVKIAPPLLLLIAGYLLVVSKKFLVTERTKERVEADSVETNKMLGISFQQQGMLDLALEKFRKIPLDEEGAKELLYNLGLDFERKRQFSKALSTYSMILKNGVNYRDLDERIPKLKGAEATMIFGGSGGHPGDIGATLMNMETRPTLGRYEVVGELGRGAMGIVYKGEDPKIHRTVAIKTVRLSDFDEEMLDEMKERFFREAESAGLLTHPNIVTIYDAGEEHDLAYIAMEFLKGCDLEEFTKKENLLPVEETLSIVAQVADALDFAHSKGVVHRDIKPANIMRLEETHDVKVTDFGIARITSTSKTKTGVIMGTPSYMSPEQVAGKRVDGRSDIFSLGVLLFEMLCGEKPFTGEDMTSLMYRIAREKHPSVKTLNPSVPSILDKIIDRALAKEPEQRYQKASQMSDHLRKILKKMDEIRDMKKAQVNPG